MENDADQRWIPRLIERPENYADQRGISFVFPSERRRHGRGRRPTLISTLISFSQFDKSKEEENCQSIDLRRATPQVKMQISIILSW